MINIKYVTAIEGLARCSCAKQKLQQRQKVGRLLPPPPAALASRGLSQLVTTGNRGPPWTRENRVAMSTCGTLNYAFASGVVIHGEKRAMFP